MGQLLFHIGPGGIGWLFSFNKWHHHLKTVFFVCSGYLCLILKLVWWSETFKCDEYAKIEEIGKGQILFHSTVSGESLELKSSLFVYWPLLFSSIVSRNRMENELREFRLLNPDLKHLRILLHGPVGAGKSSFINSINNVFQGRACTGALVAADSGPNMFLTHT